MFSFLFFSIRECTRIILSFFSLAFFPDNNRDNILFTQRSTYKFVFNFSC